MKQDEQYLKKLLAEALRLKPNRICLTSPPQIYPLQECFSKTTKKRKIGIPHR